MSSWLRGAWLKLQFVRLSLLLHALQGPGGTVPHCEDSRAGQDFIEAGFIAGFSALGCLDQLCGSRASLLNGPKERSSKPESSKSIPNMCGGLAKPQLKRPEEPIQVTPAIDSL